MSRVDDDTYRNRLARDARRTWAKVTPAELQLLRRLVEVLAECHAAASWGTLKPTTSARRCSTALAYLRAGGTMDEAEERIRATCWYDATRGPEGLRDGNAATLVRIFRPSKDGMIDGWITAWDRAGRPAPCNETVAEPPGQTNYSAIARSIDELCGTNR